MSEPKDREELPHDSLANVPPTPIEKTPEPASGGFGLGLAIAVAGFGVLCLLGSTTTATRGATRSSKLEWKRRQAEIEQAARDDDSESRSDAPSLPLDDAQQDASGNK